MIKCLSHCVGLLFLFLLAVSSVAAQETPVKYNLGMEKPNTHYFDVEIEFTNSGSAKVVLYMPVWTPGSYLEREFERNVQEFDARDGDGKILRFDKINKNTWEITANGIQIIKV